MSIVPQKYRVSGLSGVLVVVVSSRCMVQNRLSRDSIGPKCLTVSEFGLFSVCENYRSAVDEGSVHE